VVFHTLAAFQVSYISSGTINFKLLVVALNELVEILGTVVLLLPKLTSTKLVAVLKALFEIEVTELGISILVSAVQF
jgi:hypothetical protein